MFTSDMVVDLLSTMIHKVADTAEEKGRTCVLHENAINKLSDKEVEIRDLKARLAKYEPVPGHPIPFANMAPSLSSDDKCRLFKQAVREHNNGSKIGAIKVIREMTGAGLKEAKDCYEETFTAPITPTLNLTVRNAETLIKMVKTDPDEKINLIKEVRSMCGIGLKEAKDAVEYAYGMPNDTYLGSGVYRHSLEGRW